MTVVIVGPSSSPAGSTSVAFAVSASMGPSFSLHRFFSAHIPKTLRDGRIFPLAPRKHNLSGSGLRGGLPPSQREPALGSRAQARDVAAVEEDDGGRRR